MSPVWNQPSASASAVARLVVPVRLEQVLAVQQHLAVVRDPHHRAGQRLADRADLLPVPRVEGGRRAGLGQAVALQDREADAAEEVAEPLAQRGAAGDGVLARPPSTARSLL